MGNNPDLYYSSIPKVADLISKQLHQLFIEQVKSLLNLYILLSVNMLILKINDTKYFLKTSVYCDVNHPKPLICFTLV